MIKQFQILLTGVLFTATVQASEPFNFIGGIKLGTGGWSGQNDGSEGTKYSSNSRYWTLQAGYQKGPWFGTAAAGFGNYQFTDGAPDFAPADGYHDFTDAQIGLSEFDIAFGYRVWPRIYPIFGFKNFGMNYTDNFTNDLSKEYSGYSIGLAGNLPVGNRLLLFGSFAGETMNITVNKEDIGDSRGAAAEFGFAWYLSRKSLVQLSLEAHVLEDTYRNTYQQSHGTGALTLGFQRRFGQ
jgi:hypothetical protein